MPITRIDQTRFGAGDIEKGEMGGNCFQASLASLLGLHDISQIPDEADTFTRLCKEDKRPTSWYVLWDAYWLDVQAHLSDAFGLQLINPVSVQSTLFEHVECLAGGLTERGLPHSVVWKNGMVVHDPHPSRSGILEPTDFTIVICNSPGHLLRK